MKHVIQKSTLYILWLSHVWLDGVESPLFCTALRDLETLGMGILQYFDVLPALLSQFLVPVKTQTWMHRCLISLNICLMENNKISMLVLICVNAIRCYWLRLLVTIFVENVFSFKNQIEKIKSNISYRRASGTLPRTTKFWPQLRHFCEHIGTFAKSFKIIQKCAWILNNLGRTLSSKHEIRKERWPRAASAEDP